MRAAGLVVMFVVRYKDAAHKVVLRSLHGGRSSAVRPEASIIENLERGLACIGMKEIVSVRPLTMKL